LYSALHPILFLFFISYSRSSSSPSAVIPFLLFLRHLSLFLFSSPCLCPLQLRPRCATGLQDPPWNVSSFVPALKQMKHGSGVRDGVPWRSPPEINHTAACPQPALSLRLMVTDVFTLVTLETWPTAPLSPLFCGTEQRLKCNLFRTPAFSLKPPTRFPGVCKFRRVLLQDDLTFSLI
jgi:hypothetical protein